MSRIQTDGPDGPEEVHLLQEEDQPVQPVTQPKPNKDWNGFFALLAIGIYVALTAAVWHYYSTRIAAGMIVLAWLVCVIGNWQPWKD